MDMKSSSDFAFYDYPIINLDIMSKFKNKEQPPSELFCRKGAIRNFAKFTGKDLCQSFF